MLKNTFSIIIPIYNTGNHLKKLFDSIIRQTYSIFEVILVDDGSTDNTSAICKEYCSLDSRFHYFLIEHQGPGPARNFGIQQSTGTYISFLDSDDYIDDNFYEEAYKAIHILPNETLYVSNRTDIEENGNQVSTIHQGIITDINSYYVTSSCRIIFNNTLIKEHHIQFKPTLCFEDGMFICEYLSVLKPKQIFEFPATYFRQYRKESITHNQLLNQKNKQNNRKYHAFPYVKELYEYSKNAEWPIIAKQYASKMYYSLKHYKKTHLKKKKGKLRN